jgi:hypothetical protein
MRRRIKKYKVKFPTNLILGDEIEKNIFKKDKKKASSKLELTRQTCKVGYETEINP